MEEEKKSGFRYLVDEIQLTQTLTSNGLREIKIIEISETAMKLKDMITGEVFWILNEWRFNIVEQLND